MSNLPPNPYKSMSGGPQGNANVAQPVFNHSQQFGHVPASQLPPGIAGLKQDTNSNSPLHAPTSVPQNNALQNVNNYNQSGNSSPAFNQPGIMPPPHPGLQSSPMRPPTVGPPKSNFTPVPLSSSSPLPASKPNPPTSTTYAPSFQPPRQINDIAPPLVPSSQFSQPLMNGPPNPSPAGSSINQYPPSSGYKSPSLVNKPLNPTSGNNPINPNFAPPPISKPGPMSQPNVPFSAPQSGPARNSPLFQGPPISGPPINGPSVPLPGPSLGPPHSMGINGPSMTGPQMTPASRPPLGPSTLPGPGMPPIGAQPRPMGGPPSSMGGPSGPMGVPSGPMGGPPGPTSSITNPIVGPPSSMPGPPRSMAGPPSSISGPPFTGPPGPTQGHMSGPPGPISSQSGPMSGPPGPMSGPPGPMSGPPGPISGPPGPMSGPPGHVSGPPGLMSGPPGLMTGPPGPINGPGPQMMPPSQPYPGPPRNGQTGFNQPMSPPGPSSGPQSLPAQFPNMSQPMGPPSGPQMKSNMQSRYPQAPAQGNFNQPMANNYQYNAQAMTQQMGQLSVTKQGFDQLWGHHMVDLLQCKHILPEYAEDPPEIKLGHQFADSPNCSNEIFRCTVNRIPETNSLLQKSRLPLGILVHPFKDLNHLPVIQCNTIVRCRACRTYINPFVYFVDAKRWKCNLCFRVNDLPEEFQYDPVSKSYGDPSRRPEIKSATIEFIAPGEYMLRPPQPAVYLFLLDVSQLARESGYLQVVCDTLKSSLDQLPGDARTQVGFICFDSHIHYYLMRDDLAIPKEMTVLDIDDVFLPSPESLLVNLAECRDIITELLSVLPRRYSAPGVPGCALGAALQAAYKLMAPTGGRITVFQTCLPNVGPGALQPREDPNARSSKDVAHLNPATDFYKRLALECSGAQVAIDLFLLNSQYSDLATLSGMSKFCGGTVYHIPLFKASRPWQAQQLNRMFARYLNRKIGFEAVMRVRCTRGISIHTFHGNFFVRSTDLLSLPNVSPDAGFAMQLCIEESLSELQQACFQAALLYTSSKGERRIRVHTLALPIATTLSDVLHSADQQCIIGLLSKMATDRAQTASLSEAREAVINVAVDALSAHRLAQNLPTASSALHAPLSLKLLPLYLLALLKRKAFRTGTSTRLDDRVADMCALKVAPLNLLLLSTYPALYPVHELSSKCIASEDGEEMVPDPPRLHLTAERVNSTGAYLLDDGESMILYIGHNVSPAFLSETLGVTAFSQIPDDCRTLPALDTEGSQLLHAFIERLNDDRPYISDLLILRDNSPSRTLFTERLVDDRVESAFSYYEFLQHVKSQVK